MPDRAEPGTFRSAEDWLAARGVRRDPLRVDTTTLPPDPPPPPDPSPPAAQRDDPAPGSDDGDPEPLEDAVARAVAFIRRSTAAQPASEARLRDKLERRGTRTRVIELALEQARRERLVDDDTLVRVLAEERRAKGHAATRVRMDLRKRGFPDALIDRALATTEREDPEAVAFGVARAKAAAYAHLAPETAFRRLVGYLARRGHPEGLSRKVAREVVWADREHEHVAGH